MARYIGSKQIWSKQFGREKLELVERRGNRWICKRPDDGGFTPDLLESDLRLWDARRIASGSIAS
ncbi:MAG: hypothetical protein MUF49_15125 [Oculatellaceae cyanobacterium Prado106]|nr:hypothetical protein [Oculatellaceae cyanobacterium Prado106]